MLEVHVKVYEIWIFARKNTVWVIYKEKRVILVLFGNAMKVKVKSSP
jgi:hypothetical protein